MQYSRLFVGKSFFLLVVTALTLLLSQCGSPQPSTLLIRNATIVDGTGSKGYIGSVRIEGKLIAAVGDLEPLQTDSVIDGTGLVLSPGFIDTHSHHSGNSPRSVDAAISQGITTIIVGQDGSSFTSLEAYFDSLRLSPISPNVGSYVGHNTVRRAVLGNDFQRKATREEIDRMKLLVTKEMEAGALGLSTGLEYDPGIYSSAEEVLELAKVASQYGGRYISHMRSEDVFLKSSIQEILTVGREANMPVQISHFKIGLRSFWGQAPAFLALLDSARAVGIDVTADVYPYEYWQSTITVLFPDRDFENRATAEFALTELTSPEGMIIGRFEPNKAYEGLTLDSIARLRNEDPVTTYLALVQMSLETGASIIAKAMDIEDIKAITQWPYANICSDGGTTGHPRGWGAFPRYFNLETREPIEMKIHKMTAQAAENLDLDSIGVIREGFYADLTLFDPNTFIDHATYGKSSQRATGLKMVLVSGAAVYDGQEPTNIFSGRLIRGRHQ
ncbi:amidohydrolase family protein [Imperialibacter roseus]|uniref:Amidohydrolase family protein n=1 Tax=Imperialibacter roseus TaxID=1324217 RepID=A0ABZ0IKY0_9BACT|nr:amidohydrolase family protein [Imperialibacter roseus]WOK04222.1 amidohydrolase family protein [Imperialibacter roseus]